jgi:hypothetical protein
MIHTAGPVPAMKKDLRLYKTCVNIPRPSILGPRTAEGASIQHCQVIANLASKSRLPSHAEYYYYYTHHNVVVESLPALVTRHPGPGEVFVLSMSISI